jgi:hypothetical protein
MSMNVKKKSPGENGKRAGRDSLVAPLPSRAA